MAENYMYWNASALDTGLSTTDIRVRNNPWIHFYASILLPIAAVILACKLPYATVSLLSGKT